MVYQFSFNNVSHRPSKKCSAVNGAVVLGVMQRTLYFECNSDGGLIFLRECSLYMKSKNIFKRSSRRSGPAV